MAYAGINFEGFKVMAGLGAGPGAEPLGHRICKKFDMKIAKMHYFNHFSKIFQNFALNFCAFGRKHKCLRIFDESLKFWWKVNRKIEFLPIFEKSCSKWTLPKYHHFSTIHSCLLGVKPGTSLRTPLTVNGRFGAEEPNKICR